MNKLEVLKNYLNYVIEHKDEHYWRNTAKCHCGLLLRSLNLQPLLFLTNVYEAKLAFYIEIESFVWNVNGWYKYIFEFYKNINCDATNIPFTDVVNTLLSYGFTLDELASLEHLQDKRFIDLHIRDVQVKQVDSLIEYLTNWIKYEEQLTKTTTKEQVSVKVPVS